MKRKTIAGYLLGIVLAILLVCYVLLSIIKTTIFNETYVRKMFDENNYYKLVYNKILDNMEKYLDKLNVPKEMLNNIYTETEVKTDIDNMIGSIFGDKKFKYDEELIENRITKNINKYIDEYNVKLNDIEKFINEIVNIYKKGVNVFNVIENFINLFQRVGDLIRLITMLLLGMCLVIVISIILIKVKSLGFTSLLTGVMLYIIKIGLFKMINLNKLNVITKELTEVVKDILEKIGSLLTTYAIIFFGIGIFVTLLEVLISIKNKKKRDMDDTLK